MVDAANDGLRHQRRHHQHDRWHEPVPDRPCARSNLGLRPPYIHDVSIVDSSNVTYPLRIIGVDEWSQIVYKPAPGRPMVAYFDGNVPAIGMYLYPTPAFSTDVLHLWYGAAIPAFNAVTDLLSAPPGYDMAFTTGLAQHLCIINGRPVTPDLHRAAVNAKNSARNTNNQPELLDLDIPMGGGRFNIFTGSYNF